MRAIDQHADAVLWAIAMISSHRIDGAERVGNLGDGNERVRALNNFGTSSRISSPRSFAGMTRSFAPVWSAQNLPRHDVRVVLQNGDHHLIALADITPTPGTRHQIDRLGGAASPDDGSSDGRVEEAADLLARGLERVGRTRRERVGGAMHVGIVARVEMGDAVDHGLRLVRGRGVVEPDQRLAVDIFVQDREVAAEDMRVELPGSRKRWQRELWNMLRR